MAGLFKYRVLNFILLAVVLSTAFMNYETWSHSNGSGKDLAQRPDVKLENKDKTEALAVKEKPESLQSFRMIAEKNIFNPERKEFPPPALLSAEQPKPVVRPQVILSGVIISENYQAASVSSPGRPLRKGEREAMTLKVGDRIGEYKLAKIADDRITMEAAGDSFEVLLYDSKKPKTRVEVKAVDIVKAEVMGKPVESAQGRAMAHASPFADKDALISRSRRSEAIHRALMASNQPNTGIVESTKENRDISSGLGKTNPQ